MGGERYGILNTQNDDFKRNVYTMYVVNGWREITEDNIEF
jgi:hypothetical protein